jgi:hypothetical protein
MGQGRAHVRLTLLRGRPPSCRPIAKCPRAASQCSPDADIESSGSASAAATPSRTGASCPTPSMDGSHARMVLAKWVRRPGHKSKLTMALFRVGSPYRYSYLFSGAAANHLWLQVGSVQAASCKANCWLAALARSPPACPDLRKWRRLVNMILKGGRRAS